MKRLLCAALTVVMIFALCAPAVGAEETEALPQSYHAPTIQRMIDANLQTGNTDEEFFHLLANAFLVDPAMVSELLSRYTQDEITWLTKAIAYDLQRTDRVSLAAIPADADVQTAAMARLVLTQARDTANSSLNAFLSAEELALLPPDVSVLDTSDIFIRVTVPTTVTPSVAEPLNVEVTVGSYSVSSTARTYSVFLYKTVGGTTYTVARRNVTIPANQIGATVTVPVSFTEAGEYVLSAKIDAFPSPILSSDITVNVNGKWHIEVELPVNRNYLGTLTLYDASGAELISDICLGKSESGASMLTYAGNTPTGEYTGRLGATQSNTYSYGPYNVIEMEGQSGVIIQSGRNGIWIHGGDPAEYTWLTHYPLRVTHGCVRVTNGFQLQLQETILDLTDNLHHLTEGTISITESADIGG